MRWRFLLCLLAFFISLFFVWDAHSKWMAVFWAVVSSGNFSGLCTELDRWAEKENP